MNSRGSFYVQIFKQQNALSNEQKVIDLNPLYTLANVTRQQTRHVVRYPPQFSPHYPSTQATSTHGKSIIIQTLKFTFYQPINFYIILNLILFIAEYPDVYKVM